MTALIDISNLNFSYASQNVLQNISLTIYENDFIGIIGPNGGGKTTFLKLLLNFLKPSSGWVKISSTISRLSYVPQNNKYDPNFPISALEVTLSGLLHKLSWSGRFQKHEYQAAHKALDQVGLADLANRPYGELSGGQAKRVLIARALIDCPKILILDEPTAGVDKSAETEIYQLLTDLKGKMTILMVTHDLFAATKLVDKLLCIQKTASFIDKKNVCNHFALGLYHESL